MLKRNSIFGTGCYPAGLDGRGSSGEDLLVPRCALDINSSSSQNPRPKEFPRKISTSVLLLILRIIRSWNQTGQKHAGEPDIARSILPAHTSLLWALVLVTYLTIARRLLLCKPPPIPQKLHSAFSLTLCMVALRFKASFTSADAPELLIGLPRRFLILIDESSLVDQARAVFLGIGIVIIIAISTHIVQRASLVKHNEGKIKLGALD